MALAVVGNVDVEQVLSVCDKMLKSAPNLSIERSFEKEDRDVAGDYTEYNLAMSIPVFSFGYKEECAKPKQDLKTIIETTVLLEIHYLSLRLCFKILLCCFFLYSKLKCNYSEPCKIICCNIGLSMNCNYKKGDFYEIARTLY